MTWSKLEVSVMRGTLLAAEGVPYRDLRLP
jgi:hypothetical protein